MQYAPSQPTLGSVRLPAGSIGYNVPMVLKVFGGLHYIKANAKPYFSLTCWYHRDGHSRQCEGGGADHDTILQHFPELYDLAALHFADIDGVPMHVEANGWYWMAGALGGAGERYHGGNSKGHHGGEYREPTPNECLEVFRKLYRIDRFRARLLLDAARADGRAVLKDAIKYFLLDQWKAEAEACIKRHSLSIYGDHWEPNA